MIDKHIFFLGASGAGKSTLINALVSDEMSVVPAGGIGPCTAQAIVVRYGDKASFKAIYHTNSKLLSLLAGLATIYQPPTQIDKRIEKVIGKLTSISKSHNQIDKSSLQNQKKQKIDSHGFLKQANLLITGQQESKKEITYLMDALFAIIYDKVLFKSRFDRSDIDRIRTTRLLIGRGSFECSDGNHNYRLLFNKHVSGHLAPIIKSFDVRVKSELLKTGLVFIDLPGVGIDGDIHQKVTIENIVKADAIMLVVPTRGIGDAEHNLMKAAGIYNRLFSSISGKDVRSVNLTIAVTRVDDIAYSRFKHVKKRKQWQHLFEVCTEAENNIRRQLRDLLREEYGLESRKDKDDSIVEQLSRSIQIFPVSAVEFRKFHKNDPDDRPFITNASQSNIPRLRKMIAAL